MILYFAIRKDSRITLTSATHSQSTTTIMTVKQAPYFASAKRLHNKRCETFVEWAL